MHPNSRLQPFISGLDIDLLFQIGQLIITTYNSSRYQKSQFKELLCLDTTESYFLFKSNLHTRQCRLGQKVAC